MMKGQVFVANNTQGLSKPQGLARDLPFLLFADAIILIAALIVWSSQGGLVQTMTGLGFVAAASLGATAWFAVLHRTDLKCHGFLVLEAAWTYWYFVPMLLIAFRNKIYLDGQQRDFAPDLVAQACVAVIFTKFVSVLIYQVVLVRPVLKLDRITELLNRRRYTMSLLPIAVLLFVGLVPFLISGKPVLTAIMSSRSAGGVFPRSNFSGIGGGWFALTFVLAACTLLGLYRFLAGKGSVATWIALLLGITALTVSAIAVSTRTMLLASVMPALMFYMLGSRDRWRAVKVFVFVAALWVSADLLINFRTRGLLGPVSSQEQLSRNLVDNDFFCETVYAVSAVPDQVRYSYEDPTFFAAITPIPRAIWPGKPIQEITERVMRLRVNMPTGELMGNALPGIVGQYWEVAGWIGLAVLGIWLGGVFAIWDRVILLSNWNVRYIAFSFVWGVFISFRSFALTNLMPALFVMGAILVFSRSNPQGRT